MLRYLTDTLIMKESSSGKSDKLDRWLIGISLFGILGFFYLLSDESLFRKGKPTGNQIKIGSVQNLKKDVRRRIQDDFIWLPLNDLETVYLGDAIFTGNNSTTSVYLDSGIKLWIDPDSLVVLDQTSELMKLDLQFGHVRGSLGDQASATLKLNINNQDLDLAGKAVEFLLAKGRSAETKLQVTNGVANVTESKSKKQVKVAKDHGLKMQRGIASVSNIVTLDDDPVFVRQEQWAMHKNVWFAQKQALKFTWQTEGPVDHFELIVSRKSNLSEPLLKETLKVNGFEWIPPFDEGSLYWKVRAYGATSKAPVETEVIQWNIGLLLAPEWKDVRSPYNVLASDLANTGGDGASKVVVQWQSNLKAVLYRLEWSKDSSFAVRESVEVKQKKWNLPKLPIGQYFVRVRSEGLGRPASLWSNPLMIDISDKDPDGLVTPKMAYPEIETLEKNGVPQLNWETQGKASGYLVEVSDRADFGSILQSSKVKAGMWTGAPKPRGDYFVRIFPLASNGRKGPVSGVIPWHSRLIGPQWKHKGNAISIAIPRDKSDQLLPFPPTLLEWKDRSSDKVSEFNLEQDIVPEFTSKKELRLKENKFMLAGLNPGVYFYRLRSQYADGKISLSSEILKVEVFEQQADGLVPPNLISKSFESQLKGDESAAVKVKWDLVPSSVKYKVEMAEDAEFKVGRIERVVNTTSVDLAVNQKGNYLVRVAGLSKANRVGPWSRAIPWKVSYGPPLLVPVPPIKIVVHGADSPVPPTLAKLNWKAPKGLNNFLLELTEDNSFSKINISEQIKGAEFRLKLTKQVKYKARVKGIDEKGEGLTPYSDPINVHFFVNRPIPPPELLTPKDKVSYILSKMKNPQIWLEWSSDKLAEVYKIEIAKDKNFNKVLHSLNSKEKKILLDHNVIRGKLYWRVKAINEEQNIESPWSVVWGLSVVNIENED